LKEELLKKEQKFRNRMGSVFMLYICNTFPAIVDTVTSTEVVQYHLVSRF